MECFRRTHHTAAPDELFVKCGSPSLSLLLQITAAISLLFKRFHIRRRSYWASLCGLMQRPAASPTDLAKKFVFLRLVARDPKDRLRRLSGHLRLYVRDWLRRFLVRRFHFHCISVWRLIRLRLDVIVALVTIERIKQKKREQRTADGGRSRRLGNLQDRLLSFVASFPHPLYSWILIRRYISARSQVGPFSAKLVAYSLVAP